MARTALTPEVHGKIVKAMRAGNYFKIACAYAGIAESTGYKWLAWGAPDLTDADAQAWRKRDRTTAPPVTAKARQPYRELREAVARASAEAEVEATGHLVAAARTRVDDAGKVVQQGDWRAAEAFLRSRAPDRWGRQRVDVQHGGEVKISPVGEVLDKFDDVFGKLVSPAPEEPTTEGEQS